MSAAKLNSNSLGRLTSKDEWRKFFRTALADFSNSQNVNARRQAESKIQEILMTFLQSNTGFWGGYKSLSTETSLDNTVENTPHLKWAFSKIEGPNLKWFIPGEKGFELGPLKALEPVAKGAQEIPLGKIHGLIIPGLGFDRKGHRLGRGKGYYDRALAGYQGIKIGVGFACQMVDSLPAEDHDVKLDLVINENGLFKPNPQLDINRKG